MKNKQAIEQLKDLRESLIESIDDNVPNSAFRKDVEALDIAIKALEGTAQEVPVQEQLIKKVVKKELTRFRTTQIILNMLLLVSIVFQIVTIVRRIFFLNDLQIQLDILKELLLRFQ